MGEVLFRAWAPCRKLPQLALQLPNMATTLDELLDEAISLFPELVNHVVLSTIQYFQIKVFLL